MCRSCLPRPPRRGTLTGRLEQEEAARLEGDRLRDGYDRDATQLRSVEDEVRDVRGSLAARRDEAAGADMTVKESELRLEHQDEAIREKWQVELATWTLPPLDPEGGIDEAGLDAGADGATDVGEAPGGKSTGGESSDEEEIDPTESANVVGDARKNALLAREPLEARQRELGSIRKSIQALGDVNVGAIEEHEELAERFRFLSEQKEDLDRTIATLQEAIARINRTSRRRFRETFDLVSKRFSENFPRLFGGGKASLILTDAEDVLEAGIDVVAMPPGKRLQNVNLLSGGEKTMTALALLVAVFQVRPSPFFLLDEVDAALDDANVGRFNGLIAEMAQHSQFLIITHNKKTIEVADVLYGVTMEQKGVSKLVAVALS